jgi:hypothetical protein
MVRLRGRDRAGRFSSNVEEPRSGGSSCSRALLPPVQAVYPYGRLVIYLGEHLDRPVIQEIFRPMRKGRPESGLPFC